jgi:hypothetical protein
MRNRNTRLRGLVGLTAVLASLAGSLAYADPNDPSSQTATGSTGSTNSTGPTVETSTSATSGQSSSASSGQSSTGAFSRLPFELSASVQGGYDDNVGTTNGGTQGSPFSLVGLQVAYNLSSPRTQISFHGGASFTYYWDHQQGSQEYDISLTGGLSIQHKASPRLTLTADLNAAYLTEPQFADNISIQRRSGNFFYAQDQVSATYLWSPRFQTVTSYSLFALAYDDQSIGLFEDRYQHTIGNEFKFIWQPQTALVVESRLELVNYNHEGDFIGNRFVPPFFSVPQFLQQDSVTHFVLGGVDHNFSPRLSVSVRGGAQFRDYVDSDRNETAPYFEAALNYAAGRRTTLIWTNRYGLEEPDTVMTPVRTTFRSGLQVSYAFTQKINASAGIYFVHDDYHTGPSTTVNTPFGMLDVPGEPGFSEQSVDLSERISYAITPHLSVEIGYAHTEIKSDFSVHFNHQDFFPRAYSRNRGYGGLTYNF